MAKSKGNPKEQAVKVLSDLVPDSPHLEGDRVEKQAILGLIITITGWVFLDSTQENDQGGDRSKFAVIQFETSTGLKTTSAGSPQIMQKLAAIERVVPNPEDRKFDAVMDRRKTKNGRFTFILRDPEDGDKRA